MLQRTLVSMYQSDLFLSGQDVLVYDSKVLQNRQLPSMRLL